MDGPIYDTPPPRSAGRRAASRFATPRGARRRAALRALGALLLGFVVFTAGWVAVYRFVDPPGTIHMALERARLGAIVQQWAPLERLSPHLRRAVLAAEDARFCGHFGFDFEEISRALERAERGGKLRGASTISQQTAKNVFLWVDRSWVRKVLEVWFVGLIELMWPKQRILEVYLNVAEFGDGVFGAEAAAQEAFGRSAEKLELWRAARLAVTLPAPGSRDAAALGADLVARAEQIAGGAETLRASGAAACVGG